MTGVTLFLTPIELLLHLNEAIGFLESETKIEILKQGEVQLKVTSYSDPEHRDNDRSVYNFTWRIE